MSSRISRTSIQRRDTLAALAQNEKRNHPSAAAIRTSAVFDDDADGEIAAKLEDQLKDPAAVKAFLALTAEPLPTAKLLEVSPSDPSAWIYCWGGLPTWNNNRLRIDGAVRSSVGLPAEIGHRYKLEYAVRLANTAEASASITFFAAPIVLTETSSILQPTQAQPPLSASDGTVLGEQIVRVEDEQAHKVFIGLQGPTGADEGINLPEIEWVRLRRLND